MDRNEAKEYLAFSVSINMLTCTNNYYAGLYAIDFVIPAELNAAFYLRENVEFCGIALIAAPCVSNPNNDLIIQSNLFRSIIRSCGGPKDVGIQL